MALACERHVQAEFGYLADIPLWNVEKPYAIDQVPGTPDGQVTNIQIDNRMTRIGDLRSSSVRPTLSEHSFTFLESPSNLSLAGHSEEEMMTSYANEVNTLLRGMFDTDRVITYDLRFRENRPYGLDEVMSSQRTVPSPPVTVAHVDHSRESAWMRIARHTNLQEQADIESGRWRIRIINTWRPLVNPADGNCLAFCNPKSVQEEDLVEVDRISPTSVGAIYNLKFNPEQKWFWLPSQKPTELAVFLSYDSHPPGNIFNFAPHTAFDNPEHSSSHHMRRSVETRTMVFTPVSGVAANGGKTPTS